jgi:hypothetical protein
MEIPKTEEKSDVERTSSFMNYERGLAERQS